MLCNEHDLIVLLPALELPSVHLPRSLHSSRREKVSRINNGKRVENENDEPRMRFAQSDESEAKNRVFVLATTGKAPNWNVWESDRR